MAGEVSVHVVDVARGLPATGMTVEIFALYPKRQRILSGFLDGSGLLTTEATEFPRGPYEAVLHVATLFRSEGVMLPDPPFLDEVPIRFTVAEANAHYRIAVTITPWGYSVFRGR